MKPELKNEFIDFLDTRGEYFKKVHDGQYRIRCPFCGDTQKNFNEGHLYIKCDLDNDDPISYNCFKCGEHSRYLTYDLIEKLKCPNDLFNKLIKGEKYVKRIYKKENPIIDFDFKLPEIDIIPNKLQYIDWRLGIDMKKEDYENMKVITSLFDFLAINNIKDRPFEQYILNLLQKYYIGFLSNGSSHILFRDITNKQKYPWIKYPITKDSKYNHLFYTIRQNPIDIFTEDEITVNLSEGVFDALGIAYHFNYFSDNTMNVSVLGKQYISFIRFLINLGVLGGNISINIFSDNDENFNKDKKNPNKLYDTSFYYLTKILTKYRPLFNKITLYHNIIGKDYGVKKENIKLKKKIV